MEYLASGEVGQADVHRGAYHYLQDELQPRHGGNQTGRIDGSGHERGQHHVGQGVGGLGDAHGYEPGHHDQHARAEEQGDGCNGKYNLENFNLQDARGAPAYLDEVVVNGGEHRKAATGAE